MWPAPTSPSKPESKRRQEQAQYASYRHQALQADLAKLLKWLDEWSASTGIAVEDPYLLTKEDHYSSGDLLIIEFSTDGGRLVLWAQRHTTSLTDNPDPAATTPTPEQGSAPTFTGTTGLRCTRREKHSCRMRSWDSPLFALDDLERLAGTYPSCSPEDAWISSVKSARSPTFMRVATCG